MIRSRVLPLVSRAAPIVAGIGAGAAVILALLDQDWTTATWAGIAAGWAFVSAAHRCPAPPVPDRGLQCVHFVGGPQDGGHGFVSTTGRDLDQAVLTIDETDYLVSGVRMTHWAATAEVKR